MAKKDITSCRGTIEFLQKEGELLTVSNEVDPILEVAGFVKALDNSFAFLFQNVKGYPGQWILADIFSRAERVGKIFGVADCRKLKFKGLEAVKKPIPPKIVDSGPCQEVVITKDIDALSTLPVLKHTAADAGRILGGGVALISGPDIGYCISFKRTHFRGRDWASLAYHPGSHFEYWILERRKQKGKLPLTINVCPSPAVMAAASAGITQLVIPPGSDELGIAGGLQGTPVELCNAKTGESYSIANSW